MTNESIVIKKGEKIIESDANCYLGPRAVDLGMLVAPQPTGPEVARWKKNMCASVNVECITRNTDC